MSFVLKRHRLVEVAVCRGAWYKLGVCPN